MELKLTQTKTYSSNLIHKLKCTLFKLYVHCSRPKRKSADRKFATLDKDHHHTSMMGTCSDVSVKVPEIPCPLNDAAINQ